MIDFQKRFGARTAALWASVKPEKPGLHVQAAADGTVELLIYDAIGADMWGEGVAPKDVISALADAGDSPVLVRINSPGGDVFDGMAIFNALQAHKAGVAIRVDGLAASAASVIALAGPCTMSKLSQMMIHNSRTVIYGDKASARKTADVMAQIDGQMAALYAEKSGKTADEIVLLMDAETWFTPQEAVAAGLADSVDNSAPKKTSKARASAAGQETVIEAPVIEAAAPEATAASDRARRVQELRLKLALAE